MSERLSGVLESVKVLEPLSNGLSYCEVVIGFDELKVFGDPAEMMELLNKTVFYTIAQDYYKGQPIVRVLDIAEPRVIQTAELPERSQLIPRSNVSRVVCNFSCTELKRGDWRGDCIAIVAGYEYGSSRLAQWIDFEMIDRNGKSFNLRRFLGNKGDKVSATEFAESCKGHYIMFAAENKKYGIQTNDEIEILNKEVTCPEEVYVAMDQIQKYLGTDNELASYVDKINLLEQLKSVIYGEPGYHLVEIASELQMIDTFESISREYDYKLLGRMAVASRGYLLPAKIRFSKAMLNCNHVLQSELKNDKRLLLLLDEQAEIEGELAYNKKAYERIHKFCEITIEERRSIV